MPGEFESISERIKGQLGVPRDAQLGVQNNLAANAKAAAELQQDRLKLLLEEELRNAGMIGKLDTRRQTKFRVPRGTTILILKSPADVRPTTLIDGRDFEAIICSKDVVYDPEDVCMNPTTGECTLDNLRNSLYFRDENYFAFNLPPNDKQIPFILVQRHSVHISTDEDKESKMMDFINEAFKNG